MNHLVNEILANKNTEGNYLVVHRTNERAYQNFLDTAKQLSSLPLTLNIPNRTIRVGKLQVMFRVIQRPEDLNNFQGLKLKDWYNESADISLEAWEMLNSKVRFQT